MTNASSPRTPSARAGPLKSEALAEAWRALDLAPGDRGAKAAIARLLRHNPMLLTPERRGDVARLLVDPDVEPTFIARAGWCLLSSPGGSLSGLAHSPQALANWIEGEDFALALLAQSYVAVLEAETALTRLRRWLLLSGRWPDYPRLVAALTAQAGHNGGAWWIGSREKARLASAAGTAIAGAYGPCRVEPSGRPPAFDDPVTRAVSEQYRGWPYPAWTRLTAPGSTTVPAAVAKRDGGRPSGLPVAADLLVAGCGTGHEAALRALNFPDATITAIDISAVSLAYAAERCAALGIRGIDFLLFDIHKIAELGRSFDFISCCGVLHHLLDPEAGWTALADVLKPGGAMEVMVYSKVARLGVRAARSHIADLLERPIDDDLLREVRKRLVDAAPKLIARSADFYTLGGVHDLLLHRHEDPFDVPRIVRALDRIGLELLAFDLPTPTHRDLYRREHPEDPAFRDVKAWAALEMKDPFLFNGMYKFWCRKPLR